MNSPAVVLAAACLGNKLSNVSCEIDQTGRRLLYDFVESHELHCHAKGDTTALLSGYKTIAPVQKAF